MRPRRIARLEFLLQSVLLRQQSCPYCGSRQIGTSATKHIFVRVERCRECLLYFTSPIYRSMLYPDLYEQGFDPEGAFSTHLPTPRHLDSFKRGELEPGDRDFRAQLTAFASSGGDKTLLEIGSSWGYMLYQARELGFDATGIEIARGRREFGRKQLGVEIVGSFADLGKRQFDIVFTYHVLEHFTDLSTIFREIHEHLKPGGKLVLEVPNFDYEQFGRRVLKAIGAIHPLGFSSAFFQRNLPKCGFTGVHVYSTWSAYPDSPVAVSTSPALIVQAQKPDTREVRVSEPLDTGRRTAEC